MPAVEVLETLAPSDICAFAFAVPAPTDEQPRFSLEQVLRVADDQRGAGFDAVLAIMKELKNRYPFGVVCLQSLLELAESIYRPIGFLPVHQTLEVAS